MLFFWKQVCIISDHAFSQMQCIPEGNWKCILDFYLSFLLFLAVSLIWRSNFLLIPQMESFSFELLNLFSYLMNFLYLLILTDGEAKFCSELGAEMSLIRDCVTIWLNLSVPDELKGKKIRFAMFLPFQGLISMGFERNSQKEPHGNTSFLICCGSLEQIRNNLHNGPRERLVSRAHCLVCWAGWASCRLSMSCGPVDLQSCQQDWEVNFSPSLLSLWEVNALTSRGSVKYTQGPIPQVRFGVSYSDFHSG